MGFNREGIVKVYLTTIRPILEYGVQVWQDIPEFLSNKLESIQKRALHIIYPCHSYLDALYTTNLRSLKERQTQLCCKCIQKMSQKDHPINFLKPRTASSGQINGIHTYIYLYIYTYIYINIMRGKKDATTFSRQACFVNRFTLYIYINIYMQCF